MIIRPAIIEDLDALLDLEHRSFSSPWSSASVESELIADDRVVLVIADPGSSPSLLASLMVRLLDSEAELLRISVRPALRRQGLGGQLLQTALDQLTNSGIETCFLEVREDNVAARALYEGFGARVASRRFGYFADGTDAIVLAIDLVDSNASA